MMTGRLYSFSTAPFNSFLSSFWNIFASFFSSYRIDFDQAFVGAADDLHQQRNATQYNPFLPPSFSPSQFPAEESPQLD